MSRERLGKCNHCSAYEGEEHAYPCPYYEQATCPECGCDVKYSSDTEGCYDHLPDGEEMRDYAEKKAAQKTNWNKVAKRNATESKRLRGIIEALKAANREYIDLVNKVLARELLNEKN